jgi:DNA-directed RNA polymerase subunit RPC12/RpoP/uncharacterized protein YodC (DUF2158 family)
MQVHKNRVGLSGVRSEVGVMEKVKIIFRIILFWASSAFCSFSCEWVSLDSDSDHCAQSFETVADLEKHVNSEHITDALVEDKWLCLWDGCDREYKLDRYLRRHISDHFQQPSYVCKECSQGFGRSDYLMAHVNRLHPHTMHYIQCNTCGYSVLNTTGLVTHESIKHAVKQKYGMILCEWFENATCGEIICTERKGFTKNFLAHILSAHAYLNEAKRYVCKWPKCRVPPLCYKREFKKHMREHLQVCVTFFKGDDFFLTVSNENV